MEEKKEKSMNEGARLKGKAIRDEKDVGVVAKAKPHFLPFVTVPTLFTLAVSLCFSLFHHPLLLATIPTPSQPLSFPRLHCLCHRSHALSSSPFLPPILTSPTQPRLSYTFVCNSEQNIGNTGDIRHRNLTTGCRPRVLGHGKDINFKG